MKSLLIILTVITVVYSNDIQSFMESIKGKLNSEQLAELNKIGAHNESKAVIKDQFEKFLLSLPESIQKSINAAKVEFQAKNVQAMEELKANLSTNGQGVMARLMDVLNNENLTLEQSNTEIRKLGATLTPADAKVLKDTLRNVFNINLDN